MLQETTPSPGEVLVQWNAAQHTAQVMDAHTARWHTDAPVEAQSLLLQLHRANFDLWHLEDLARDRHATDRTIAEVKRSIDKMNQHRNDLAERVDTELLNDLAAQSLPRQDAPLHSETPGQMFDRVSILSLKIFHTAEELQRPDADETHRERNRTRLSTLQRQRDDLCDCLTALHREVLHGERRFQQYRQFKMYNDPDLNPVLYAANRSASEH